MAFEAMVRIAGPGETRLVPLEKIYVPPGIDVQRETILKPNEIITEILLPPPAQGLRSSKKCRWRLLF
jgi:xanthine dehydrogenase YagS FAD-binding subunit